MSVSKEIWGNIQGCEIYLITLTNNKNMKVCLTNYGAAIISVEVPDKFGTAADVVLGYDNLEGYVNGSSGQGAVIGRYANRIAGAKFMLNDTEYRLSRNNGENCLHGGFHGFNKRIWGTKTEEKKNSVTFTYFSPAGEEHFPGNLEVNVTYSLNARNGLHIEYKGRSNDEDTVFNPTNHVYFNLGEADDSDILDTVLQINSLNYTPTDEFLIPTGEIATVLKTPFNFTKPRRIGIDIEKETVSGYDHNYLLGTPGEMRKAAVAHNPKTGRIMACFTDMPAIQLYTGNGLSETGKNGKKIGKYGGFCLETQYTPDTPNLILTNPEFPSCVLKKGKIFKSETIYAFGIK